MPSNKRNKTVSAVRVWKRHDRGARWYCTLRLVGRRPITRSCRSRHRSAAEDYAQLLLRHVIRPERRSLRVSEQQIPLILPPSSVIP